MLLMALEISFAQGHNSVSEKDYVISANDIVEVTVYGELDLSVTARVATDGTMSYPLLGNISAAGFTVRELEKNITDLLASDYLVSPQISVFVKEYAKISILGQVRNPGSYQMKESLTLTQAVALAGGFDDTADTSMVKIIRGKDEKKETLKIDVDQVLTKESPDVEIRPNDTIIVEEYGRISIMGQVLRPGVYTLKKGLNVVEAIGLAGGFSAVANQNGTRVIRVEDGKKKVLHVPVGNIVKGQDTSKDIMLQAGDTIVVPESFF